MEVRHRVPASVLWTLKCRIYKCGCSCGWQMNILSHTLILRNSIHLWILSLSALSSWNEKGDNETPHRNWTAIYWRYNKRLMRIRKYLQFMYNQRCQNTSIETKKKEKREVHSTFRASASAAHFSGSYKSPFLTVSPRLHTSTWMWKSLRWNIHSLTIPSPSSPDGEDCVYTVYTHNSQSNYISNWIFMIL